MEIDVEHNWVTTVSEYSTMHGFAWYTRFRNKYVRRFIFVLITTTMIGLPVFIMIQFFKFVTEKNFQDNLHWVSARELNYPNITLCNRRYFDKGRMEGERMRLLKFVKES